MTTVLGMRPCTIISNHTQKYVTLLSNLNIAEENYIANLHATWKDFELHFCSDLLNPCSMFFTQDLLH